LINSKHVFLGTSTQFAITKVIEMAQSPPSTLCHAIHRPVRTAQTRHSQGSLNAAPQPFITAIRYKCTTAGQIDLAIATWLIETNKINPVLTVVD
jgi:hypothetical protein